jgi:hypothetical protein
MNLYGNTFKRCIQVIWLLTHLLLVVEKRLQLQAPRYHNGWWLELVISEASLAV